jgi:putative ABC transport system permease protein
MHDWMNKIWQRLAALLQHRQLDRDLEDELAFHLAMREGKNRETGVDATEARYAARRQFGNVSATREMSREMWTFVWLESLAQDVRYAVRGLCKSPGFTTVAVLTLALGVGACSSIFSVVNAVLLRQLSYKNADRLVLLWGTGGRTVNRDQISFTDLQDWRRNSHSFEEMANFHTYVYTLTESDQSERVRALQVSDSYFRVMQTAPLLGRFFFADDLGPGKQQVAVLSYEFWQQKFAGDPGVVGRAISLNLRPFVIIGVAPQDLQSLPNSVIFRPPSQLYTPVESPYSAENRRERYLRGIGLLRPDVSLSQAQAELDSLVAGIQKQYPNQDGGRGVRLVTLKDDLVRNVRSTLIVLQLAVLTVVLIACANVANLLLARSTTRQREIAIRGALGASGARLTQQVLTESVLLALLGGAFGVLLAYWGVRLLTQFGTSVLPELSGVSIDASVLLFTTATAFLTGIVFWGGACRTVFHPRPRGRSKVRRAKRGPFLISSANALDIGRRSGGAFACAVGVSWAFAEEFYSSAKCRSRFRSQSCRHDVHLSASVAECQHRAAASIL